MAAIELSDQLKQALRAEQGKPLDLVDPNTQEHFVVLSREQYDRVRSILEPPSADPVSGVPEGVLASQKAFWRALPELLQDKSKRGKWVCYHRDERIGIGDYNGLVRECLRRKLTRDQYDLFVIAPRDLPPWEPEEVDPIPPWHLGDPEEP